MLLQLSGEMTVYGFWLYLMTDCILFASIFAVYAVLVNNVAGGPSGHDIFELPYVLGETALLLFSSIGTSRMPSAVRSARSAWPRQPGWGLSKSR